MVKCQGCENRVNEALRFELLYVEISIRALVFNTYDFFHDFFANIFQSFI